MARRRLGAGGLSQTLKDKINNLRRSRQYPVREKTCFKPVSGSWAPLFTLYFGIG